MYAGKIVESGDVRSVFHRPLHPYTQGLLSGLLPLVGEPPGKLDALPGQPPQPDQWPTGCRFHPRCRLRTALGNPERCVEQEPVGGDTADGHWAACHFADVAANKWTT
jgi:oligopeptide/dipeptide ABC transporter ATP-binding protein